MKSFLSIVILSLGILWIGGGILFITTLPLVPQSLDQKTDGIIVLTGGADRIETALELLITGNGQKLLISGVHPHTTLKDILQMIPQEQWQIDQNQMFLDYVSRTTRENAQQSALWVQNHHFKTIRLVTAHYHLPRALLEFRQTLSHIQIIFHPIIPRSFHQQGWLWDRDTLFLLFREYHKYIGAQLRFRWTLLMQFFKSLR